MSVASLRAKHAAMSSVFTERSRRIWAAAEAQALGLGGTAVVERVTGISASTIRRGMREVAVGDPLVGPRTRRVGGGRKRATDLDPTLLRDLEALVEPTAPGDPDSPLRWTCLSARTLAVALGDRVSHTVVAELLRALGYSLQGNVKTREDDNTSIETPSFGTSRGACAPPNGDSSRPSPSTPRRRSSSARSRMPARRGVRRRRRSGCASTTSSCPPRAARRFRMASTTCSGTRAG
jgi:hypothetical protein